MNLILIISHEISKLKMLDEMVGNRRLKPSTLKMRISKSFMIRSKLTWPFKNIILSSHSRGILGMDNYGWENTNSSRFYVTFRETPWMNNFHVAFGELVEGFDVLDSIEKLGILEGNGPQQGRTKEKIVISDCGLYEK